MNEPYEAHPMICDFCSRTLTKSYVDGATTFGPSGKMCPICFSVFGRDLDDGLSELYEKRGSKWIKVQGQK